MTTFQNHLTGEKLLYITGLNRLGDPQGIITANHGIPDLSPRNQLSEILHSEPAEKNASHQTKRHPITEAGYLSNTLQRYYEKARI
jgi:hypothetical protein